MVVGIGEGGAFHGHAFAWAENDDLADGFVVDARVLNAVIPGVAGRGNARSCFEL